MKHNTVKNIFSKQKSGNGKTLIKVCAWCPKKDYPQLKPTEEFTHGMCRKHYRELSVKKNMAVSLFISELINKTLTRFDTLDEKTRKSSASFFSQSSRYLKRLENALRIQSEEVS